LIKEGAEVKIICSPDALHFVTTLTLSTLSQNPVYVDFFDKNTGTWNNHVELAKWADAMIIAPATANTIAKMAHGLCDNLLLATYLSATCPIFFAPAMDLDMYQHPTFVENKLKLSQYGLIEIEANTGFLASGLEGKGRMAEPEEILGVVNGYFMSEKDFEGIQCLVTAGPTYEALDPVRFIGNHSSGKMGIAIANELAKKGGIVHLVLGPVHLQKIHPSIIVHHVTSSDEMAQKTFDLFSDSQIIICSAAVADYKPANFSDKKIKKKDHDLQLELVKTIDILATLGSQKSKNQRLIGFALENDNELENATRKLHTKNADAIVLNSMNDFGAGFRQDTNKITILQKNDEPLHFDLKSKKEVASDIIHFIKGIL
jgi:phosphopantothenoylcysteine decarboxylase/phosphopantothenate--cysteine ligase